MSNFFHFSDSGCRGDTAMFIYVAILLRHFDTIRALCPMLLSAIKNEQLEFCAFVMRRFAPHDQFHGLNEICFFHTQICKLVNLACLGSVYFLKINTLPYMHCAIVCC